MTTAGRTTEATPAVPAGQRATCTEEGQVLCRWKPTGPSGSELLVMLGDLTKCKADAIVNAANGHLMHGGGLAAAIVRRGGLSIQQESSKWIEDHKSLPVGEAITTAAGKLPCKHVIHTVGPDVRDTELTLEHTTQLHCAVQSALMEAHRLEVHSVAIPGISTGMFGYPRNLGAKEIVKEAVRFCMEKGDTTTVQRIVLMNIDEPTVESFTQALKEVKEESEKLELKNDRDICEELTKVYLNEQDKRSI